MREVFREKRFSASSLRVLSNIVNILEDYARQGYTLTLRQVYYQLVSRGLIENTEKSYKRIGDIVSDGRMAGLIDWDYIEDRARETVIPATWEDVGDIARSAAAQFRVNHWEGQAFHVELLVEKQALEGVLEPVARRWGIPFTANKGYLSQSMVYQIAKRIKRHDAEGKTIVLLYLGDHDPSGMDMDRDILDRLTLFTGGAVDFDVTRLALLMDQVKKFNPPENPAKITDSRAAGYIRRYGRSSWELDALEPRLLERIVSDKIAGFVNNKSAWEKSTLKEEQGRKALLDFSKKTKGVK